MYFINIIMNVCKINVSQGWEKWSSEGKKSSNQEKRVIFFLFSLHKGIKNKK